MKEQICRISPETQRIIAELCQSGEAIELWACDLNENRMCSHGWDAYEVALRQGSRWVQLKLVMPPEGDEELQTFEATVSECTDPWGRQEVLRDFRGKTSILSWQKVARWDMPVIVDVYQDRLMVKGTQDENQRDVLVNDVAIGFCCCGATWILQHTPWYRIGLFRRQEDMLDCRDSWPYLQDWLVSFQQEKRCLGREWDEQG